MKDVSHLTEIIEMAQKKGVTPDVIIQQLGGGFSVHKPIVTKAEKKNMGPLPKS